jgi:hypothetical protein
MVSFLAFITGITALSGFHWEMIPVGILVGVGVCSILEMLVCAVNFSLKLFKQYYDGWQEFKQQVEAQYGPIPVTHWEGQEFVEPKFNLRRLRLDDNSDWSGNYCIRRKVVGFTDPTTFRGWTGKPDKLPVYESRSFMLPGRSTRVPYLRDVSA